MTETAGRPRRAGSPAGITAPTRTDAGGTQRSYIRFAALGDSVTHGLGDPESRGWARILADAISNDHDVSFCNLARPGATTSDVRFEQLTPAIEHRPHLAALIVGLNDTMHSSWDADTVRSDLMMCAHRLAGQGALLLTVRFHDHGRVFRLLPRFIAQHMRERIAVLNDVFDEIDQLYGGLRVDLTAHPGIYDPEFWSIDRLHPSELGHRALAHEFAAALEEHGLAFEPPDLELDGEVSRFTELSRLAIEGVPWLSRRLLDLAPGALQAFYARLRPS